MADTVKMPVIGPVKRGWVIAGASVIAGVVGWAYWNRRQTAPQPTQLPEDIPQDREPPPTTVGTQEFDDANVRAIINTNAEWYRAATDYLVTTGGYDFAFTTITLGKFLARRNLTQAEADLVQAAKGATGDPPQGGPWPILRGTQGTVTPAPGLSAPHLTATFEPKPYKHWHLRWTKPSGAIAYGVYRQNHTTGKYEVVSFTVGQGMYVRNGTDWYSVKARSATNKYGTSSNPVHTTRK